MTPGAMTGHPRAQDSFFFSLRKCHSFLVTCSRAWLAGVPSDCQIVSSFSPASFPFYVDHAAFLRGARRRRPGGRGAARSGARGRAEVDVRRRLLRESPSWGLTVDWDAGGMAHAAGYILYHLRLCTVNATASLIDWNARWSCGPTMVIQGLGYQWTLVTGEQRKQAYRHLIDRLAVRHGALFAARDSYLRVRSCVICILPCITHESLTSRSCQFFMPHMYTSFLCRANPQMFHQK